MDLLGVINELIQQRERLDNAIAQLEALQDANGNRGMVVRRKRGRSSMGEEERAQVSERMRRYWDNRRRQRLMNDSSADQEPRRA